MDAVVPIAQTGHVSALQSQPRPRPSPAAARAAAGHNRPQRGRRRDRVRRRRVEQLQIELRVYRTNKFNQDTARRMEDLENDLSMMEIERDNLKAKLERAEP